MADDLVFPVDPDRAHDDELVGRFSGQWLALNERIKAIVTDMRNLARDTERSIAIAKTEPVRRNLLPYVPVLDGMADHLAAATNMPNDEWRRRVEQPDAQLRSIKQPPKKGGA